MDVPSFSPMAFGRPVVSTALGCRGLEAVDGEHLVVADGVEAFAEQVVRLLTDQRLCQSLSANARRLVVERYDWGVVAGKLERTYAGLWGEGALL